MFVVSVINMSEETASNCGRRSTEGAKIQVTEELRAGELACLNKRTVLTALT